MGSWPVPQGRTDGLVLAVGHSVAWDDAQPQFYPDQPHAFATREVVAAPTASDLPQSQHVWQTMHSAAVTALANAGMMPGVASFEIRYVATPTNAGVPRVQVFLTAMVRDWHHEVAKAAVVAACEALPLGFSWVTPARPLPFGGEPPADAVVLELRRNEELTSPEWAYIPADFYYTIADDPGDSSGWEAFWRALISVSMPVTVSLLFQQTDFVERDDIGSLVTQLEALGRERQDYDFAGRPTIYPACSNARLAAESWSRRVQQLQRPILARLAVRGRAEQAVPVANALATAVAMTSDRAEIRPMYYEGARDPADTRQANFSFDWMEILPWGGHHIWSDELAPQSLRRLPYLFGLDQAATLAILPVPTNSGVAGMAQSRAVDFHHQYTTTEDYGQSAARSLNLGHVMHRGGRGDAVNLPVDTLTQNLLLVGSSGFGKTTTVQSLLVQLWRDCAIPFLVIEPYPRSEYRNLISVCGMELLRVYTIGNDRVSPFRFNPLSPPAGVPREVHQQAVLAALKTALPLFSPQDSILVQAIPRAYEMAGWFEDTVLEDGIEPPTLRTLLASYRQVFAEIGYEGEARNIGRGFATRMEALLTGSKGRALDTVTGVPFEEILRVPTIIELKGIIDAEESAIFASFLVDRIREEAVRRGNSGGRLVHVTLIEEAQQILGSGASSSPGLGITDTRAAAVQSFANAVSTLRALGEGVIMSTQRPSELHPQAVANTANRIVLHLEEAEDRVAVVRAFDADESISRIASRLRMGEALVRWPGRDEPEVVAVVPTVGVNTQLETGDDLVADHMAASRKLVKNMLPYRLCTQSICTTGCESQRRQMGARIAASVTREAKHALANVARERGDPAQAVADALAPHAQGVVANAYCAAAHLAAQDVLKIDPSLDVRSRIVEAVVRAVNSHE